MTTLLRTSALLALIVLPLAVTGCSREVANNPMAPEPASLKQAQDNDAAFLGSILPLSRILFVHASPDAPAVDIFYGLRQVADGLAFPSNTPYRWVLSGSRTVRVNVDDTRTTVIKAAVTLDPRKAYSVFAVDRVSSIAPLVLVDDLTPPAPGNAHVRFVHLSPDAPAVDVALDGGAVVFGNKAFKESTPFTPLPAGTYDLEVRVAGTTTVALDLDPITLQAGRIYTVFAKGLLGGTGTQALGAQIIVNSEARRWTESLAAARSVGPEER
jgi:hypothetical protein